jgi:hypothetical protein
MVRIELPTRCCRAIGTSIGGKEKDRNESRLESGRSKFLMGSSSPLTPSWPIAARDASSLMAGSSDMNTIGPGVRKFGNG